MQTERKSVARWQKSLLGTSIPHLDLIHNMHYAEPIYLWVLAYCKAPSTAHC